VDRTLVEIRRAGEPPIYFLGREFAGLPLTHAESVRRGHGFFVYGTCEVPKGPDAGGCTPPVQIQIFPFDPEMWSAASGCRRLRPLRGVLTVRHDGLVLFTRNTVVKIYARGPAEDRRVARALRAVANGPSAGEPLPPPHAPVLALASQVCR
jgi:hypothetical protein